MKLLDKFNITDKMELRLQIGDFEGKERVDIRQYLKRDNEYIPLKKGINFDSEWVDRFITMVEKLKDI